MSKRFRAIKQEFKKHRVNINNRDVRHYLHTKERMLKMKQRFLNHISNKKISINVSNCNKY